MSELKGLERRIRLSEYLHLALITPCLALPAALLAYGGATNRILWAFAAAIPVLVIALICDFVNKPLPRFLLSIGVVAAAAAPMLFDERLFYFAVCCIPVLIGGLFVPHHRGRQVFTIPTPAALAFALLTYAVGKLAYAELLCRIAVILSAFISLNYFLYKNQTGLLKDIRLSLDTEVSVPGLIRQNRRTVAVFLAAGILMLAAMPFILRGSSRQGEPPVYQQTEVQESEEAPAPTYDVNYVESQEGKPFNIKPLSVVTIVVTMCFGLAIVVLLVVGTVYLLDILLGLIERKNKHSAPDIDDGVRIERLKPEASPRQKEHLAGYEKKIRRGYERLIKSRAPEKARLAAMTPTELEHTAGVTGSGSETIHSVYSRTRYGGEPATAESYAAFKEAVRALSADKAEGGGAE